MEKVTVAARIAAWIKLPEQDRDMCIANLKRNWLLPCSALAFFCLNIDLDRDLSWLIGYILGISIALSAAVLVSSQIKPLPEYRKETPVLLRLLSLLTAVGICWAEQETFYNNVIYGDTTQMLLNLLPSPVDFSVVEPCTAGLSVVLALSSLYFVSFCLLCFWKKMADIFSENQIFQGITRLEMLVYGCLLMASMLFVITVFAQSAAFYGTEHWFDLIYTSDSPLLVKGDVYLTLTNPENDLRQPLFAVFAAPFLGLPFLLGKLLAVSASVQAMLINIVQVSMLLFANFLLASLVTANPYKRICFMALSCFTYTQLLFPLMMEQYLVAYFWLILCLYLICRKQQPDRLAYWGAGGTLLTSLLLLPFLSDKSPRKAFQAWFWDMVKYGLEFVFVMLFFCRFDVIYSLQTKVSNLSNFTGKYMTVEEKLFQYTNFLADCMFAPDAGIQLNAYENISWQLNAVYSVSLGGIGIAFLAIVSAFLNRHKKISQLALVWAAFSAVMLFVLGWGTQENGLILYALYFGWAFFVLLFQLLEWMEEKLHTKMLVPVISLAGTIVLAVTNIPAILEMIRFAITYYPV